MRSTGEAEPSPAGPPTAFADRLETTDASHWNACFAGASPFVRHEFLDALERHRCVSPGQGWQPHHLQVVRADGALAAAAPLYLKAHSYGEFVFDFAWADASHRIGQAYYPKLLCAVPFTPSVGPRLGARDAAAKAGLVERLQSEGERLRVSSAHALFVEDDDAEAFRGAGWHERHDIQFQWFNRGDRDFAGFLARLSSDKRKKILRERRRVAEAGIRFEVRAGVDLDAALWAGVYALYANTYEERGQAPYLSADFLLDYGSRPDSPLRVILAWEGPRLVAAALTLQAGETLYGRHWGAAEQYHSLHFECCYYQGIELCLREGLRRYDAGTQGPHKLARGFDPVITRSFHWLRDRRLSQAVGEFVAHERRLVGGRCAELRQHGAYRQEG